MSESEPNTKAFTLVGIRRDPDGTYTVVDAIAREHCAGDDVGLGKLLARLAIDPDLPKAQSDTERNPVVAIVGQIARKVVTNPRQAKLVDLMEPLAHAVGNELARRAERPVPRRRRARVART